MPSSRGSSRPGDRTCVSCSSCIAGGFFTAEPPGKPNSNIIYLLLQLPVLPYIPRAESDTSLCFEVIQLLLHLLSIYQTQGILRETKNESGTQFCLPSIIRLIWKIHWQGEKMPNLPGTLQSTKDSNKKRTCSLTLESGIYPVRDTDKQTFIIKCSKCWFNPWVGNILWSRVWQPTPVFWPEESPWTEEPGGLQSMGVSKSWT